MKKTTIAFGIVVWTLAGCSQVPEPSGAEVNAAVEDVCCGARCCAIEGGCQSTGEANPANPCQVCDPTMSQTAWTDVPGCTPDAGSAGEDAGPVAEDAGPIAVDAGGPIGTDSGPIAVDAGGRPRPGGGGGGCAVTPGQSSGGQSASAWLLGVLGALFLATRRRRR